MVARWDGTARAWGVYVVALGHEWPSAKGTLFAPGTILERARPNLVEGRDL